MNFILSLFIAFSVNAQEGSGFQEIDPAKDVVLIRKREEKLLLEKIAKQKKADALKAEAKRKEDERIAAEEKKKAAVKLKEAEAARVVDDKRKAQLLKDYEENVKKEKEIRETEARLEQNKKEKENKLRARSVMTDSQNAKKSSGTNAAGSGKSKGSGFPGSSPGKSPGVSSLCKKPYHALEWEKNFRKNVATWSHKNDFDYHPEVYPFSTEKELDDYLCSCRFQGVNRFPDETKVIGIGTYVGTLPAQGAEGIHPMTEVNINVSSRGPVVLVIRTYEPIHWKINASGAKILGVLVLGYYQQRVSLNGNIPVTLSTYEGNNDVCNYTGPRFSLEKPRPYRVEADEQNKDYGKFNRRILDDRSLLLTGKKVSNFFYNYQTPNSIDVNDN